MCLADRRDKNEGDKNEGVQYHMPRWTCEQVHTKERQASKSDKMPSNDRRAGLQEDL